MKTEPGKNDWVFAVIENPGAKESFLGYTDRETNIPTIPIFLDKEDAQACFPKLPQQVNGKYEIQAVLFSELCRDAARNEFEIVLLNGQGVIVNRINPAAAAADESC
ncbi:MAG: hypothetical protein ACLFPD_04510 [Desulfosudaceae bacterium]